MQHCYTFFKLKYLSQMFRYLLINVWQQSLNGNDEKCLLNISLNFIYIKI